MGDWKWQETFRECGKGGGALVVAATLWGEQHAAREFLLNCVGEGVVLLLKIAPFLNFFGENLNSFFTGRRACNSGLVRLWFGLTRVSHSIFSPLPHLFVCSLSLYLSVSVALSLAVWLPLFLSFFYSAGRSVCLSLSVLPV